MKAKDLTLLRKKDLEELSEDVSKKHQELTKVRANLVAGKEKNLKSAKLIRRDLVQLLTIIREKEIQEEEKGRKES